MTKGMTTVVMSKQEHESKMDILIRDTATYDKL